MDRSYLSIFALFVPFSKLPFLLSNCCDKLFFLFFTRSGFIWFALRFFLVLVSHFSIVLLVSFYLLVFVSLSLSVFYFNYHLTYWNSKLSIFLCYFFFFSPLLDLVWVLYKTKTLNSFHFDFVNMANFSIWFGFYTLLLSTNFSLLSLYVFWIGTVLFPICVSILFENQLEYLTKTKYILSIGFNSYMREKRTMFVGWFLVWFFFRFWIWNNNFDY